MTTENHQEPNSIESSSPVEGDTTPDQESIERTSYLNVEFVNPKILISRQTPSEMSGSKVKRLRKKIREKGFDSGKPINVANVDGKLIILDGHHRVAAARQLRLKTVPIMRREVSPNQAAQLLQEAVEAQIYRQE